MASLITRHHAAENMPRHRHREGYIAVVLAGEYVEAGDRGRIRVQAGQALIHGAFEAHQDHFAHRGAVVLNLPLREPLQDVAGFVDDPDAVARLAEKDLFAATALLRQTMRPAQAYLSDWPDELARDLAEAPAFRMADWARSRGIAPQSISRGFRRTYGVSPQRYRIEQRTLQALRRLPAWTGTLAALAMETGFADQAHLTRSVVALTGLAPRSLRVKCVQEGNAARR